MAVKIIDLEKYGGLRPKPPLFPAIIIPSKVGLKKIGGQILKFAGQYSEFGF